MGHRDGHARASSTPEYKVTAVRIVAGLALMSGAWMTWLGTLVALTWTGFVSVVFLLVGVEVLITGLIGWSPMYALCGFSTKTQIGA